MASLFFHLHNGRRLFNVELEFGLLHRSPIGLHFPLEVPENSLLVLLFIRDFLLPPLISPDHFISHFLPEMSVSFAEHHPFRHVSRLLVNLLEFFRCEFSTIFAVLFQRALISLCLILYQRHEVGGC